MRQASKKAKPRDKKSSPFSSSSFYNANLAMKLTLRQIRLTFVVAALILLAGGGGYWLGTHKVSLSRDTFSGVIIERVQPSEKQNLDFSLFWDVWDRLSAAYLDKSALKPAQMVYGAIQGMVASLKDPYTVFLPPSENKQAKEDLNGAFEGVGIELGYNKDEQLMVVAPISGMPAEKAGVKAGDLILKIEDKETLGITLPEAVKQIRGPKGTKVKLTLLHSTEKELYEATIIREEILVPSVEVAFIGNIAHLKLTRFGDRTNEEWEEAVEKIVGHQPRVEGVIFDLRNNPGGYLAGSVFIASEFLSSGVVVQQESSKGTTETFSVNRRGRLISEPLVVLINEGSASASEIVAGCLQDYKRAKVVGEKSFGKGTVQEAQDLPGGSGLHITTARWLLPKGKFIDKSGVIPDYEIKDDQKTENDEQLEKALEVIR